MEVLGKILIGITEGSLKEFLEESFGSCFGDFYMNSSGGSPSEYLSEILARIPSGFFREFFRETLDSILWILFR